MIKTWKVAATCAIVALVAGVGVIYAPAEAVEIAVAVAALATLTASAAFLVTEMGF